MSRRKVSLLLALSFYIAALVLGVINKESIHFISIFTGGLIGIAVMHFLNFLKVNQEDWKVI